MKLPYGVTDFERLRTAGYAYVDRTSYIPVIEDLADVILFVRPRRFGKSLWLRTLMSYYDVLTADRHEELFGGLAMGAEPTPLAHRYFVLQWDFSDVRSSGSVQEIEQDLHRHVNDRLEAFVKRYRDHLGADIERTASASTGLQRILSAVQETPYKLYLLIDEYDNFVNEVMTINEDVYRALLHADGPFKQFMKTVKAFVGLGIERVFLTGVTPVVLSDMTSAFNIATNAYTLPKLNALCGFTHGEVRRLVEDLHGSEASPKWSVEEACDALRTWYNGYRFSPDAEEPVYNPTLVLYCLHQLQQTGGFPRQMLDKNLGIDENKLRYAARLDAGQRKIFDVLEKNEPVTTWQIEDRFTLTDMIERTDASLLTSYLYYVGMLTLEDAEPGGLLRLTIPNLVVRKMYYSEAARFLLPDLDGRDIANRAVLDLLERGELGGLLAYIEEHIFGAMSNRDYRWNELALKTVLMTLLFKEAIYVVYSEPELRRTYSDLFFMRRPELRSTGYHDLLFELKRLTLKEVGLSGKEVRALGEAELKALGPVKAALAEAEQQGREYRDVLVKRHGKDLRLRTYVVVSVGLDRLVGYEVAS